MAADECRSAKCSVHQLKFATLPEFPDDTPDFSDVVGGFAMRRCQARVTAPDGGRMQVPMCAEDVSETGIEELFDDEGYLTAICPRHANMLIARAVEGRACTGAMCGGADQDATGVDGSMAQPLCGRKMVGSRLYCLTCFRVREETGKTPAKPIRSARCAPDTPPPSGSIVSPLTEAEEGTRSDRVLESVFGLVGATVGAAIGAEQGTAVERTKAPGILDLPATADESSAMDDTTVIDKPSRSADGGDDGAAGRGPVVRTMP